MNQALKLRYSPRFGGYVWKRRNDTVAALPGFPVVFDAAYQARSALRIAARGRS